MPNGWPTVGYAAGWSLVRHLPEGVARGIFDGVGTVAGSREGGPEQLREEPGPGPGLRHPREVPDDLMQGRDAFVRPVLAGGVPSSVHGHGRPRPSRVHMPDADQRPVHDGPRQGQGPGLRAAPHRQLGHGRRLARPATVGEFSTVAERLKPESLFERFVRLPGEPGLRDLPAQRRRRRRRINNWRRGFGPEASCACWVSAISPNTVSR